MGEGGSIIMAATVATKICTVITAQPSILNSLCPYMQYSYLASGIILYRALQVTCQLK